MKTFKFKSLIAILAVVLFGSIAIQQQFPESPKPEFELNASKATDNNTTASNTTNEVSKDEKAEQPIAKVPKGGVLAVHYLDVGQADSIFIELPNGQTMLIDAGNNEDDKKIIEYIQNLKYDTINYLVGTHPHEDHIGGLDTVIKTFEIGNIYMPKAQTNTKTFEDVLLAIKSKNLKVTTAKAGLNIINSDNLTADIVAPVNDTYEDLNNYSAVVKIKYGDNSFLFMGDAETVSENEITTDVKADVLKVGHHGSDSSTSKEFLSKVKPTYAVISVGKDNSYGHPSKNVLALLNESKVNVFRTDIQGTIVARSDGDKILINKESLPYETNAPPTVVTASSPATEKVETPKVETPVVETPAVEETKEITVYVTKTGAKYHTSGCRYLSKSKIPISLKNAKLSYTPCKVCDPPR